MRMSLILASLCSFLISCATLTGGGEKAPEAAESASVDGNGAPSLDMNAAPTAYSEQASYTPSDIGDSGSANGELQAVESHENQAEAMNEQRSTSELDSAAPETSSAGTDSFYASAQPETPPAPVEPEVSTGSDPALEPVASEMPSELPQREVASWDQQASEVANPVMDEEPQHEVEKPVYKKSKKIAKSHKKDKKKIAKKSKKSKKQIASKSKKTKKHLAKKSKSSKKSLAKKSKKLDCKKIAKNGKKSNKRDIASCRVEKKKYGHKSKKIGKLARANYN